MVIAGIDPIDSSLDIPERRVGERRVGERRVAVLVVAGIDPIDTPLDIPERRVGERRVGERRVATADAISWMPPRRERRTAHLFRGADDGSDGRVASVSCVTCGYGEASHLALTQPEQEVVIGLLNQRQAPALMRRSILRKLTYRPPRVR